MKLLLTISTLALVALAVEGGPILVPTIAPHLNKIYSATMNITETARTFASKLVADFPATPEATQVRMTIKRYSDILYLATSFASEEPREAHLERFIVEVAVADAHVHVLDQRLRHPDQKPQDDKTKVHIYAANVLKYGEDLFQKINKVPEKVTLADAQVVSKIMVDLKFRLKEIESTAEVSNIVDTIANLALDNEALVQIAKKLGKPTP